MARNAMAKASTKIATYPFTPPIADRMLPARNGTVKFTPALSVLMIPIPLSRLVTSV